jgi:signal transduction histidine kinase
MSIVHLLLKGNLLKAIRMDTKPVSHNWYGYIFILLFVTYLIVIVFSLLSDRIHEDYTHHTDSIDEIRLAIARSQVELHKRALAGGEGEDVAAVGYIEKVRDLLQNEISNEVYTYMNTFEPAVDTYLAEINTSLAVIEEKIASDALLHANMSVINRTLEMLAGDVSKIETILDDHFNRQRYVLHNYLYFFISLLVLLTLYFFLLNREIKRRVSAEQTAKTLSRNLLKVYDTQLKNVSYILHDRIAQELYGALMYMEKGRLPMSIPMIKKAITDVKNLSAETVGYNVSQKGLQASLRGYIEEVFSNTDADVSVAFNGDIDSVLDDEQKQLMYQVCRECINNIKKHSGASSVEVKVTVSFPRVIIKIIDNGIGFRAQDYITTPTSEHIGLLTIIERVESIDGDISINSKPNEGTTISIHIPVERRGHETTKDSLN